ncbi:GntR family transcriptional regulator [Labrenzia sp. OB1]|uniref:GntR family transcriptional regulator n=1 Tax=Labrenzia sp. OB1 TaxID=1561204 RepID=UPI0008390560|nr:GntR family transcriptional regulator [Labrenzia sp. OB1]
MALFEKITDAIWDEILSGRINVGEKLKDTEWAERTGASRTPVREALRELVRDGVLVPRKLGGFTLRQITPEEVEALYHYRAALEGAALKDSSSRASSVNIAELEHNISAARNALMSRDYEAVLVKNSEFHGQLLSSCRNQFLNTALKSASRMVLFARRSVLLRTSLARAGEYEASLNADLDDHATILDLLKESKIDSAASALENHIRRTGQDMAEMLSST